MPAQLVFDPWTFVFLVMLFLLLGATCAYIGGKIFDDPATRGHVNDVAASVASLKRDLLKQTGRVAFLHNWRERFVAHHNAEHAANAANAKARVNMSIDAYQFLDTENRLKAIESDMVDAEQLLKRHDTAINGLIAANGEFNGLKAFVSAIDTVQAKQEDRLAALERGVAERIKSADESLDAVDCRVAALEHDAKAKAKRKR